MEFKHIKMLAGNKAEILLYEEIGNDRATGKHVANEIDFLIRFGEVSEILVRINSVGGNIVEGFGIFSALQAAKQKGVKVVTQNDGLAASMALPIMLVASDRKMKDYGLVMMHNPWGSQEGGVINKFKEAILKIFTGTTKMSKRKLDEMMSEETWLNAEEALKLGLVTEILKTDVKVDNKVTESRNASQLIQVYNKINNPKNTIKSEDDMEEIAVRLGLPKTATKAEVDAAIVKMKTELALKNAVPTPPVTIESEPNIDVLLALGKTNGHVNDSNIETYRSLAKKDYQNVFALIGTPKEASNAGNNGEGGAEPTASQEPITMKNVLAELKKVNGVDAPKAETKAELFLRLSKTDPDALAEMEVNDPKQFAEIQNAYIASKK